MQTLTALFSNRDFSPSLQPFADVVPTSLTWASPGGPDTAVIELRSPHVTAWSFSSLLRCPVVIRDDRGRLAWWGFVSAIDFPTGPGYSRLDLDLMTNRVQVNFTLARSGSSDSGLPATIGWQTTPLSIPLYGTKDAIIRLASASTTQATQRQTTELLSHGFPVASLDLSRPAPQGSPILVHCRGWYSTLGWRYYACPTGLEAHDLTGPGVQSMGNNMAYVQLAQSFYVTAGWTLDRISVRVRKVGNPTDSFFISLLSDSAGFPGSILAQSSIPAYDISATDYTYREIVLPSPISLIPGVNYWILVNRYGGLDPTNYYSLDVDEACAYAPGVLKIWDGYVWQARTINADLNFRLRGSLETTIQIAAMAATAYGGQFLTGISIENASGIFSSQYRDGSHTALAEITKLLDSGTNLGTPLLAEITQDRILRVYTKPDPGAADWSIDTTGQHYNEFGMPMPPYLPPVGRWLRLRSPYPTPAQVSGDPGLTWIDHASWKEG